MRSAAIYKMLDKAVLPSLHETHVTGPGPLHKRTVSELLGAPNLGSAERGHPDLFRFVPISPFSFDLFGFALLVFGNVPICSDLLRFVFRTNQNKSGKPLSADPFCKSPNHLWNNFGGGCTDLVAPYCAIPRDYLSDIPLLRAMGLFVSQHGQLGAIPPPPFPSVSPVESIRSGGAIGPPPRQKKVFQRYWHDTL